VKKRAAADPPRGSVKRMPVFALRPRKLPAQRRSQQTFDAIVDACTQLLPILGYAGTTTNHIAERAGVNIASLYEYFPGKDAIVALVAERLVRRVLERLGQNSVGILAAPEEDAVRLWIDLIYDTVARERRLLAVFTYQVPYTNDLDPMRRMSSQLLAFSELIRRAAGDRIRQDLSPASMHLIVNLVSATILQLVLDPPDQPTPREVLDELSARLDAWLR
jgi:AcrR family transcriptional regulator